MDEAQKKVTGIIAAIALVVGGLIGALTATATQGDPPSANENAEETLERIAPLIESPEERAGCSGAITKFGDVTSGKPNGVQTWANQGRALGRTCSDQLGRIGWKIQAYHVRVWRTANPGGNGCTTVGPWEINPNIVGHNSAWNPAMKSHNCDNVGDDFDWILVWDAPGDGVMVYGNDPESDRCIGAVIDANASESYPSAVKSICVI